jgi:hypothetical protein
MRFPEPFSGGRIQMERKLDFLSPMKVELDRKRRVTKGTDLEVG